MSLVADTVAWSNRICSSKHKTCLAFVFRQPPTDYNCLFLARVKEREDTSDDADEIVGTPLVYLLMESDVVKSWKISISDSDDEYQIRLVASCAVGEDQVFDFVLAKNQ